LFDLTRRILFRTLKKLLFDLQRGFFDFKRRAFKREEDSSSSKDEVSEEDFSFTRVTIKLFGGID